MEQQVADYTLTLQESDGDSEQITGSEILWNMCRR